MQSIYIDIQGIENHIAPDFSLEDVKYICYH